MRNQKSGWLLWAAVCAILLVAGMGCKQQGQEHGGKEHAGTSTQK